MSARVSLTIAFWAVAALTAILLAAWALDRGTDAASRGIGAAYALIGAPFLVLGLLVFLLTRGTAPRVVAVVVAAVPLLFLGLMAANARFGYLAERYFKSPGHLFRSGSSRELGAAVEREDLTALRRLVAAGADPNAAAREGGTLLTFALDRKKLRSAALLLELGADPTRGEGEAGRPPIIEMTATDERNDLLRSALEHGANIEFTDKWGVPLLHWAVTSRAMKNVELLVEKGARLDRRDDSHQLASPLSCALDRRMWACARFLVEHGALLHEAPGWNGLDVKFANAEPPKKDDDGRGEYELLVKAMTERGFTPPAR